MSDDVLLRAIGIHKDYEKAKEVIKVLLGVDLEVAPGEMVAIMGRSGAGKSTLLHILGGLEKPDAGEVFWSGKSVFGMGDGERTRLRGRTIGFVFQSHHLLPELTALENVCMPLLVAHKPWREILGRARECLAAVDLADRAEHKPGELSGGEQQRIAVARALALRPPLVLADEPSGNLDKPTALLLHQLLQSICRQQGTAFLIVTHNEELAAISDRQLVLAAGALESRKPV
jgi:lipoprotein-releasing system ATP-binding protein